ncbi:MAG: hypothetical protein HBSAPP03_10100 [Phycisphaerae bacterium]|nr:MAG: hypothetical protein HBSAPP03_10100 [Phycisphaerae bacterium]
MKGVLAWIKSNVLIVVFLAVIVLVLPASYVVSRQWGASIRKEHAAKVGAEMTKVSAAKVDYVLPSYDPRVPTVTHKAEPNPKLTEWFRKERENLSAQAATIVRSAVDFNRGVGPDAAAVFRREHRPLVDRLFGDDAAEPLAAELRAAMGDSWTAMAPEDRVKAVRTREKELEKPKLYEMEDKLLGKSGNPNPYQRLLDGIRAGGRADPVRLAQVIRDMQTRETEKITAGKRKLTPAEEETLRKALVDRRLGEYQARAREVSVYASMDIFSKNNTDGQAIAFGSLDAKELDPTYLFMYQWDLWVMGDVLAGVRLANTGPDGRPMNVDQAVVKRIVSIKVKTPESLYDTGEGFAAPIEPTAAVQGMIPLDPQVSITGRSGGSWNKLYDVRRATLKVIVASDRVSELVSAMERANFMSVTGLNLKSVDSWAELRDGYYHGPDNLVEATLDVETVWLRDWIARYYPTTLRSILKFPDPAPIPAWAANDTTGMN